MKYFAYIFVALLIVGIVGGLLESFHTAGDDISVFLRVLCVVLSIMLYHVGKYLYYGHDNDGTDKAYIENPNVENADVETNNSNIEQEKEITMKEEETTKENTPQDTKELAERVLKEIGCQPQENKDGDLEFKYQGKTFVINAEVNHIWISDYYWSSLSLNNPDVECLKEALNIANIDIAINNIYTIDKEHGNINLHCQYLSYFSENIPYLADYLSSILNGFFSSHKKVQDEFLKLREAKVNTDRIHVKGFC